ncbi:MAG: tyrosine-type recombinase/integrase [Gammaproteobacteria bacterium]
MSEVLIPEKELQLLPQLSNLIEWMASERLDGTLGTNREAIHQSQINAKNDYEAIKCWLAEYQHKATTLRTYQKEAERFLLWCIIQKQKPLSSIDRDDIESYANFLDDPQPRKLWCGKKGGRKQKRGNPDWKPFSGSLTATTKMTTLSVIDSLFGYLTDARYLAFNPFSLIRKRKFICSGNQENVFKVQERILEADEWYALLDTLEKLPDKKSKEKQEKERLRFLVAILYFLGLRINELATHTWNSFRKLDERWWFFVIGKGDKPAKIPVNDGLLRAIIQYRQHLQLSPLPEVNETLPIIAMLEKKEIAISARQMNKILKKLAIEASKNFISQPDKEKKLNKFSAHWLRHLSASMQDRMGVSFKHIRSNLRHENDNTTRLYVHSADEERHADMQKLRLTNL